MVARSLLGRIFLKKVVRPSPSRRTNGWPGWGVSSLAFTQATRQLRASGDNNGVLVIINFFFRGFHRVPLSSGPVRKSASEGLSFKDGDDSAPAGYSNGPDSNLEPARGPNGVFARNDLGFTNSSIRTQARPRNEEWEDPISGLVFFFFPPVSPV